MRARAFLGAILAGALLGALLAFLVGGGVVFHGLLLGGRAEGGPSLLALNGPRVAAMAARLFAVPGAIGGVAAALVAFRPHREAWRRRPAPYAAALAGLVVSTLAAPAGLGLHLGSVLGPGETLEGRVESRALATTAALCAASGLATGLVLDGAARRRERRRPH